jgi:hypothetical protein
MTWQALFSLSAANYSLKRTAASRHGVNSGSFAAAAA